MKELSKLLLVAVFGVFAALAASCGLSGSDSGAMIVSATPTPANVAANAANTAANTNAANSASPAGSNDKKIQKSFTLGKDSLSEYGEAAFDHETHAEGKYSPDGKSVIGCIECHHTDQPKSAMKPPYVTSERDVVLTMATWRASNQKVSECRTCHFQEGLVPDGKDMPVLNGKNLNNEIAYHLNCNTCHDAAAAARPELKGKKGFATSKDCLICHMKN